MAYVTSGYINYRSIRASLRDNYWWDENYTLEDNNFALYITKEYYPSTSTNDFQYLIYAYPLEGTEQGNQPYTIQTYYRKKDETITFSRTTTSSINQYPAANQINFSVKEGSSIDLKFFSINTNIPIFLSTNTEAINAYINEGDDSGKINDLSLKTNWKLYIDGLKNPNYFISWNMPNISDDNKNDILIDIMYATNELSGSPDIFTIKQHNDKKYNSSYTISFSQLNSILNDTFLPDFIENLFPPKNVCLILRARYVSSNKIQYSTPIYIVLKYKGTNLNSMIDSYGIADETTKFFVENREFPFSGVTDDGSTIKFISGIPSSNPDDENYDENYHDEDDEYIDSSDNIEDDIEDSTVNVGIGVLTSTYKMTESRVKQLGSFLWNSNIYDDFSLINSNPIENIISLKAIPFDISGSDSIINLGNVNTGIYGAKINNNFSKVTVGSINIPKKYNSFLDYAPYTSVTIYLPYIGFKELDCSNIMGKTITIDYLIDVITGGCLAQISVNNMRIYEFEGIIGIDIPITASNRAQIEASYIQSVATTIASTASGLGIAQLAGNASRVARAEQMVYYGSTAKSFTNILDSANVKYHFSTQGTPNPSCVSASNRTCFIIIDRPTVDEISGYSHSIGYKCNLTKTLRNLSGFTITTDNVDLSGITCTQPEKEELRELLSSGVFL